MNLNSFVIAFLEPSKHYGGNKSKKKHHHVALTAHESGEKAAADTKSGDKKSQQDLKTNDTFQENNENKSSNYVDNMLAKGNDSGSDGSQIQCIRFSLFQQNQWHALLDHNHQEM
jgi:hypothetical protein